MKGKLAGLALFVGLLLASAPALAGGPHHHGHYHGHGGGGWRANFFVGGVYPAYRPYWGPAYYYPRPVYYYPTPVYPVYPQPVAVVPPPPPVVAPSFSFSIGR